MDLFQRLQATDGLLLPHVPAGGREDLSGSADVHAGSPPDHDFIRHVAEAGGLGGILRVRRHHERLWSAANLAQVERWKTAGRRVDVRLALMRLVAASARRGLHLRRKTAVEPAWTPWDRSRFAASLGGMVLLLAASVTGVHTLLLNTAAFADAPGACLLTSLFVAVVPFGGKLVLELLPSERARHGFGLGLGVATAGLFLAWAVLLARLTGGLAGEVPDVLTVADQAAVAAPATGWPLAVHLQWVQLLAELCGALACYACADLLYRRHRPGRTVVNPRYASTLAQAVAQRDAIDEELRQQAEARGEAASLEADREAYVGRAVAAYLATRGEQRRQGRDALWNLFPAAEPGPDGRLRGLN
jgi:hypothetical protein